jgi:hypothetical protein
MRVDDSPAPGAIAPASSRPAPSYLPSKWTKAPLSAPSSSRPPLSAARLFAYAIALVAIACAVLWFVSAS